jgi:hypothetical protein
MHKYYILSLNILHLRVSVTFDHRQGAFVTEYNNLTICAIVQDIVTYCQITVLYNKSTLTMVKSDRNV